MAEQQCLLCRGRLMTHGGFCRECQPDHCPCCHVSSVQYDTADREWHCSHGCSFDAGKYAAQMFYTHILNSDPATVLAHSGVRVELLIPEGTAITVHESVPTTKQSDHILGLHFSDHTEQLLSDGAKFPPDLPDDVSSNMSSYDSETLRENALYAWPYTPSFAEETLSWVNDYVLFEVPKRDVRVSSYRLLEYTSEDCEDYEYCIPFEYYDTHLTYRVAALRRAVSMYQRPASTENILL